MDKEAENMDGISSSSAFSINSETAEITSIPVSGIIDQTAADLDELMYCDDILDNDEVTCPCPHSTISEDSWCSSLDSDISEMITSFDQNIDVEIKKVCQSFLNPENLETEADDFGEKEEVRTTQTGSTSRLSNSSEESVRPASCASSSSTNTAITKADKMLVSHVIDKAVKTLHSTKDVRTLQSNEALNTPEATEPVNTLQPTEAVKTLQSTEPVKTPQSTEPVKSLQSTEPVKTRDATEAVKTPVATEAVKTLQPTEAAKTLQPTEAVKSPQSTEPVKSLQPTEAVQTLQPTEAVNTLQSTEAVKSLQSIEPVKTPETTEAVKTPQSTEAVKTLEATEPVKTPQPTEAVKSLQSTEPVKTRDATEAVKTPVATEAVKTLQPTEAAKTLQPTEAVKSPQSTEPVKSLQPTEAVQTLQPTEAVNTLQSTEAVKSLQSIEPVKTPETTEAVKTPQSTEAVKTLEATEPVKTPEATEPVKTLQPTEAVKTLQSTEAVKTSEATEPVKTLQPTEAVKTPDATKPVKTPEATEPVKTLQPTEAVKTPEATEPVKTPEATEPVKTLPSPSSTSSFPPADQVNEIPQSQSQPLAKTATDFQEARSSKSCQSRESHDGVPSENNGNLADSQEDKEAAADCQLVLNSSITALIRRFFQSLSKEQWREVSEGVYNRDVKEQLTDMCTDVLRFISESVAKNVLQAIRQDQGSTFGTLTLRSPLYSAPLTEYLGITEYNMQRSLESSFSQALCDVVGADTPGRISPKFTEAIAGEVIDEVNSVLSVAIQDSLDGGSSSITAAASCLVSKDRAAKKTLEGAITTMKSFLTGRGTAIRRRIQADKALNHDTKEETPAGGCKGKRKKSQWKRCFSGWWRRKIQAVPLEHLDEAVRSTSAVLTSRSTKESKQGSHCSQEMPSTTSSNAAVGADLGSPHLELVDYLEDEDETPKNIRNGVSSLSSTSLIPPEHHVTWSKVLEDPPMVEATNDEFQEEMSNSLIHQSIDSGDEDEETFIQSFVDQSKPDSECLSNNQVDVAETKTKKSNRVFRFFHNIFSKNEKKEEKKKKASTKNQTKRLSFWLRLLRLNK
ncbi:flocculation protein FLO11-like [Siniperca chuatsi]|uniref:flocculation protein FLO11-like n=1 Tax=Siniperca chuatsi TaxID=119488 RepID=UPI001CE1ADDF|nr:flocculation protein FLO11-like [Siniperca chuatsi]